MANSINIYTVTAAQETSRQFTVNFTLGFLSRTHVVAFVDGELDGGDNQIFRTFTFVNDALIQLDDAVLEGKVVNVRRDTPSNLLFHDFQAGAIINEQGLDDAHLQTIMLVHEVFDGRNISEFTEDLNLNGKFINNMADPELAQDAATKAYVDNNKGTWRGDWVTATAYNVTDIVRDPVTLSIYIATAAHTSGVFLDDSANWDKIIDFADSAESAGVRDTRYAPIFATVASMVAVNPVALDGVAVDFVVGMPVVIDEYATGTASGIIFGRVVAAATGTADGGSYIDLANGLQFEQNFPSTVSVKLFGATGDGVTDDSTKVAATYAFLQASAGGIISFPNATYVFRLDISGSNNQRVIFEGNESTFLVPAGQNEVFFSDNRLNSFNATNALLRNCEIDAADTSNYGVFLDDTSGMRFEKCIFKRAKIAGVFGTFAQYTRFYNCTFSANAFDGNSNGATFTSTAADERSNEVEFFRCQFFSNSNGLTIEGGEKTRINDCTFQDTKNGGTAGLTIKDGTGGIGARATNVSNCYFEINDSKDIEIGLAENTTIEDCVFFDANGGGNTPNKTASVNATTAFRLAFMNNHFVTADAPVVTSTHSGSFVVAINNSKDPVLTMSGGDNDSYIVSAASGFITQGMAWLHENVGDARFKFGTSSTGGARSVGFTFTEDGVDKGSLSVDHGNGKMTLDPGFGAVNKFAVSINSAEQFLLSDGRVTVTIPTFADDAAAGVGGLTIGMLYKTTAGAVRIKT